MYEALVSRVRYHIQKASFMGLKDAESTLLLSEAADAIEELDKLLDGVSADNDALCETIERIKSPRWIPVAEQLPDGEVLAFNALKGSHGYHEYLLGYVGADSESDTGFRCENEGEILMNVTHWMPLPEPPKEETE